MNINIPKPNVCLLHHPGVQPTAGASHTKRKQDRTVTTLGTQESKGERERERHRSGNDNTQPSRLEIESKRHISCARTLCLFFSLEDHARPTAACCLHKKGAEAFVGIETTKKLHLMGRGGRSNSKSRSTSVNAHSSLSSYRHAHATGCNTAVARRHREKQ